MTKIPSLKTQLIDKLTEKFGTQPFTRGDILETILVDINNSTYEPTKNRGFFSTGLDPAKGYLMRSSSRESRKLVKTSFNTYIVS